MYSRCAIHWFTKSSVAKAPRVTRKTKKTLASSLPTDTRRSFSAIISEVTARAASSSSSSEKKEEAWMDLDKAAQDALEAHRRSPEYRELHRPGLTTAAMGLYGGEPGFEKTHRIWVDPDNSHLKHIYNRTALAKNLRYARYGYFKREMHIVDVDKLIRHARMLPLPARLLTDFLYQKVPLDDKSCAAILRYQRRTLEKLGEWERVDAFPKFQEMFERMITTNIPPVEVAVAAHEEAIRCCAVCKMWNEGWEQYHRRAQDLEEEQNKSATLEQEQQRQQQEEEREGLLDDAGEGKSLFSESSSSSSSHSLTAGYFEAVLSLCIACSRLEEGEATIRNFLKRGIKPSNNLLNAMLILTAMRMEAVQENASTTTTTALVDRDEAFRNGEDVWTFFDYFGLARDARSMEYRMRFAAAAGKPDLALSALKLADQCSIRLTEVCVAWILYNIRVIPDMGDFALDMLSQARSRGLTVDYRLITYALMYCAHQGDGLAAMLVYQQYVVHHDMNVTPELVLVLLQALRRSATPTLDMLHCGEDAIARFERAGSVKDNREQLYEELLSLCGSLGAAACAFSKLKVVLSLGVPITTRMINAVLEAIGAAPPPNGSAALVSEVVNVMKGVRAVPSSETLDALAKCHEAHGTVESVKEFVRPLFAAMEEQMKRNATTTPKSKIFRRQQQVREVGEGSSSTSSSPPPPLLMLSTLGEAPVFDMPPHLLRDLMAEWRIESDEIELSKYGQQRPSFSKADSNVEVFGRVVPFGENAYMVKT